MYQIKHPYHVLITSLIYTNSCAQEHSSIVEFLTMLVGAGGNAGNQATVLVIRGLATGTMVCTTTDVLEYMRREIKVGVALACIMTSIAVLRVLLFGYSLMDAAAICTSLFAIVSISVVLGALLPIGLESLGFDPAHAGAMIQVFMDLIGVFTTCAVCQFFFSQTLL